MRKDISRVAKANGVTPAIFPIRHLQRDDVFTTRTFARRPFLDSSMLSDSSNFRPKAPSQSLSISYECKRLW